jgi:hypothetical protein
VVSFVPVGVHNRSADYQTIRKGSYRMQEGYLQSIVLGDKKINVDEIKL